MLRSRQFQKLAIFLRSAFIVLGGLGCSLSASAESFQSQWQQTPDRIWIGPEYWANPMEDWRGADMKVFLSQTIFANAATHHGTEDNFLIVDLDSRGWPQTARNETIRLVRKAFPLHVAGDQHLTTVIHLGVDKQRDRSRLSSSEPSRLVSQRTSHELTGIPRRGRRARLRSK